MSKITKIALTAIIITKNEEKNLRNCLAALQGVADEIIVLDSFSTDNTENICKEFSVKFIQKSWEGYSASKNYANGLASNDYILSLDADEVLSEELRNSIMEVKANFSAPFTYSINRLTNYCGKWIYHCGWRPDIKPRLFDRRLAKWEGDFVHEELVSAGEADFKLLKGDCYHYSYHSVAQHVEKINHFSTLAANDRLAKGKKFSLLKLVFSPLAKFLTIYILKLGILDGKYGFIIAKLSARHNFLREIKMKNKG
jgi:glycosyltransferase involved in cell wall biosynthesis